MVASRESAAIAEVLIRQTCAKQDIGRDKLTIHADRDSSMTSRPVAFPFADLGAIQSPTRPHVLGKGSCKSRPRANTADRA